MDSYNLRFSSAPWYEKAKQTNVFIIGAGGIGSWTALNMARAGFNITIADDDIVEAHNIGGQLFSQNDINTPKVKAVKDIVFNFSNRRINTIYGRISEDNINKDDIVKYDKIIFAVDNLFTRNEIARISFNLYDPHIIDGRMTAESMMIYNVITQKDYERYLPTTVSDVPIDSGPCTFKATSFNASIIGGLITSFAVSSLVPERIVPFVTRIDLPIFNIVTQWQEKTV